MVALSSGDADGEFSTTDGIPVPPDNPSYQLRRIFLSKDQIENYYYGFSNQTLWPLMHLAFTKPQFKELWWKSYKEVNEIFAETIIEEVQKDPNVFIWINDYQLCLVPEMIKKKFPDIPIGVFWHIPWPIYALFSLCPWSRDLIKGMLAADFIGFHNNRYVKNFIDAAVSELDIKAKPTEHSLLFDKKVTYLDGLPAGIGYDAITTYLSVLEKKDWVKKDFSFSYDELIIGVDRLDYTKGIIERLIILDAFFETYPQYIGKLVHLLIGAPTRTLIPDYMTLTANVEKLIRELNWKYQSAS